MRLESISATGDAKDFAVRFRRSDGHHLDITVRLGPGQAVSAHPDLLGAGRWHDVNDITDYVVPAVQAFARASSVDIDDN